MGNSDSEAAFNPWDRIKEGEGDTGAVVPEARRGSLSPGEGKGAGKNPPHPLPWWWDWWGTWWGGQQSQSQVIPAGAEPASVCDLAPLPTSQVGRLLPLT